MRRFRLGLALAAIAAALVLALAACGGDDDEEGAGGGEGGTVTVLSLWGGSEKEAFDKVLAKFTADTGIQTQYETARDFLPVIRSRLAAGNPPSMAIVPRPGIVADLARDGSLMSLDDLGLDADKINENYSKAWTEPDHDRRRGLRDRRQGELEEHGLVRPVQAQGRAAHRLEGAARADHEAEGRGQDPVGRGRRRRLAAHRLVREHLPVPERRREVRPALLGRAALRRPVGQARADEMYKILREENLPGGVEGALATPFVDSIGQVFGKTPKAELYYEGGFVGGIATGQVNTDAEAGRDDRLLPVPRDQRRCGAAAPRRG